MNQPPGWSSINNANSIQVPAGEVSVWEYFPDLICEKLERAERESIPVVSSRGSKIPDVDDCEQAESDWYFSGIEIESEGDDCHDGNFGLPAPLILDGEDEQAVEVSPVLIEPVTIRGSLILLSNWLVTRAGCSKSDLAKMKTDSLEVEGKYGLLTIRRDGFYIYNLDTKHDKVRALRGGQELIDERFSYAVAKGDRNEYRELKIIVRGRKAEPQQFSDLPLVRQLPEDESGVTIALTPFLS